MKKVERKEKGRRKKEKQYTKERGKERIKTVGRKRKIKKNKARRQKEKEKKKMKKKKRRRGFEPETYRLGICSLNNYATQHVTLNAG